MAKLTSLAVLNDRKPKPRNEAAPESRFSDSTTHIGLVLDSSSSMYSWIQETIRGFNAQLNEIRNHGLHHVRTWFADFNDIRIDGGEVRDLYDLTDKNFHPCGGTPLLDTIGRMTVSLDQEPFDHALLIVFSDGQENQSVQWSWKSLGDRIKKLNATGKWTFVFIGPKQFHRDIIDLGFKRENLHDWDDPKQLFDATALGLRNFLQARNRGDRLLPAFFGES